MRQVIKTSTLIAVCASAVLAQSAVAADKMLNAAEVKKIVEGNTITAQVDGKSFKAFFDAKGKYTRMMDGKSIDGTYSISADGTHCVDFADKHTCAKIRDNGNNTFTRIEDGKEKATWLKVESGKNL